MMRTCATLIYADGKGLARYGIFVGPMYGKNFAIHQAKMVGIWEIEGRPPDYRKMTARYATKEAPAVDWQA